ncbi:elongation factor 1-beta'-like isoform X2 [Eriocheir sinensis]|uniref:elongation factor 1-beta'-like isoform X2 n=1 Tax=Eriocheir sinensis TaxID=95602 RepID=UPI0021C73298|nr:elongation factor 1-beta'-like isoform X2 [Eriocheir sinensis]
MALELAHENIWFDKWRVDDAERQFYETKSSPALGLSCARQPCTGRMLGLDSQCGLESQGCESTSADNECSRLPQQATSPSGSQPSEEGSGLGSVASQIAKARQEIKNSLSASHAGGSIGSQGSADVLNRLTKLESQNSVLTKTVSALEKTVIQLTKRLDSLDHGGKTTVSATTSTSTPVQNNKQAEEDDDDDEVDLFGSDDDEEEDEAAAKVREQRLKAYAEKKSKKPGPIAKSSVLLDCKPWDDETDMGVMEKEIRKIEMDGLIWGAAKLVPLAYGIQKLSILCTVEDEKVSIDDLSEKIQEIEDYVQSVDIAAFNKV